MRNITGFIGFSLLALACGTEGEQFFGAPWTAAATGTGGSTTTDATSGTGGVPFPDTAANTSVGGSSASSSNTANVASASTGMTTGPTSTTSTVTTVVAASSSTGMPVQNTIDCGSNLTCNLDKGEACCWDNMNLLDGPQNKCVSGPIDNDGCNTLQVGFGPETRIDCQDAGDCDSNKLCCARRKQFFANGKQYAVYDQVTCEDTCDLKFKSENFVLCIPNVTVCPLLPIGDNKWIQSVCKASQLLPNGYYVCSYQ